MIQHNVVDIKENEILQIDEELLRILLKDRTTGKNIIWATNNYSRYGKGYKESDQIQIYSITKNFGYIIKPRTKKSFIEQKYRIKDKAEVFTQSWVCNIQNNLIDNEWFHSTNVFNTPLNYSWKTNTEKICFKEKKWIDYVKLLRLEISCGEAPYLVSRYDTTNGKWINVSDRIGILDRKMRVICENAKSKKEWIEYSKVALKSVYGYEWQGDSLLIARENILFTYIDYYKFMFKVDPDITLLLDVADIISWNIFQMDGTKYVVPNSCKEEKDIQMTLFGDQNLVKCEGCQTNNPFKHNGIYCKVMDWAKNKKIRFVDILKEKKDGKI